MPGKLHEYLVMLGERWGKRQGFSVVESEVVARGPSEQADVICFRSTCSLVIEAKASRADFLVDARKPHRAAGGLGVYRFYISPPGVIEAVDLPPRWGLLHAVGNRVVEVCRPMGNMWPSLDSDLDGWAEFQHEPDWAAERAVLFSIARRRSLSRSDERYEQQQLEASRERGRLARRNDELAEQVKQLQLELALARNPVNQSADSLRVAIRRRIA